MHILVTCKDQIHANFIATEKSGNKPASKVIQNLNCLQIREHFFRAYFSVTEEG